MWHMDDRLPDMSLPGSNKPCHLACECPSRLLAVRISAGQKGCCVVESSFISPTQSCTVQHSNLPYTHGLGKLIPAVSMPTPRGVHSRIPGLVSARACVVPTKVLAVLEQLSSGTIQNFLGCLIFTKFLSHVQLVHPNH